MRHRSFFHLNLVLKILLHQFIPMHCKQQTSLDSSCNANDEEHRSIQNVENSCFNHK